MVGTTNAALRGDDRNSLGGRHIAPTPGVDPARLQRGSKGDSAKKHSDKSRGVLPYRRLLCCDRWEGKGLQDIIFVRGLRCYEFVKICGNKFTVLQ